jgi:hypothetical protein
LGPDKSWVWRILVLQRDNLHFNRLHDSSGAFLRRDLPEETNRGLCMQGLIGRPATTATIMSSPRPPYQP